MFVVDCVLVLLLFLLVVCLMLFVVCLLLDCGCRLLDACGVLVVFVVVCCCCSVALFVAICPSISVYGLSLMFACYCLDLFCDIRSCVVVLPSAPFYCSGCCVLSVSLAVVVCCWSLIVGVCCYGLMLERVA